MRNFGECRATFLWTAVILQPFCLVVVVFNKGTKETQMQYVGKNIGKNLGKIFKRFGQQNFCKTVKGKVNEDFESKRDLRVFDRNIARNGMVQVLRTACVLFPVFLTNCETKLSFCKKSC